MTNPGHIFISYARKDGLEYATRLEHVLNEQGYATWRDIRKLEPEQDFTAQIEQGIEQAAWVVVCITPDVKRGDSFVRREIQYALVVKKPVLVARFGDVTPPIHIINQTWIEFWKDWSVAERQLLSNLQKAPVEVVAPASDDPFRPYVERLLKTSVNFLQKTVISLIDVESTASPEAVEGKAPEVDMLAQLFEAHEIEDETETKSEFKTFAEAFEQYHGRILLLGEPGAGKTITLMATTREAATRRLDDPTQLLPLFGLIPTWDAYKQLPLMDWLVGALPELKGLGASKHLHEEDMLYLLDGLDELPESRPIDPKKPEEGTFNPRIRFLEVVERSSAKMIVSCRIEDFKSIQQKAALDGAVTLKRLTDEQVQAYLRDLPLLWKVISADSDLLDIAKTPLLLSIMAFAFQKQPENLQQLADLKEGALRDAIFNAYIRERYDHERRKLKAKGLKPPFELDVLIRDLGWLAMRNAADDDYVKSNLLTTRDFWRVIGSNMSPKFISFCEQLSLILAVDSEQKWRFIHLKLRDTLAYQRAEKLMYDSVVPIRDIAVRMMSKINETRPITQLSRAVNDVDGNLSSRAKHVLELFRFYESAKAFTTLTTPIEEIDSELIEFARTISELLLGPSSVDNLAEDLYGKGLSILAQTLLQMRDNHDMNGLLALLNNEDKITRSSVAVALGRIGDNLALEGLLQNLDDQDKLVRSSVVEALEQIGNEEALRAVDEYEKTQKNRK